MPVYLAHGFRWPRDGWTGVRVYTILNNLEEVSPDYIQNAHSRDALLASLRKLYPELMSELEKPPASGIDFLEQYDPDDVSDAAISQPFAFVCDRVIMIAGGRNADARANQLLHGGGTARVAPAPSVAHVTTSGPTSSIPTSANTAPTRPGTGSRTRSSTATSSRPSTELSTHISALSLSIEDVTSHGAGAITPEAWAAFAELRDNLAEGERIGWWVIFNGDPERSFGDGDESEEDEEDFEHVIAEEGESEEYGLEGESEEDHGDDDEDDDKNDGSQATGLKSTPSSQSTVVPIPSKRANRSIPNSSSLLNTSAAGGTTARTTARPGSSASSSSSSSSASSSSNRQLSSVRSPATSHPSHRTERPRTDVESARSGQQQKQQQQQQQQQKQNSPPSDFTTSSVWPLPPPPRFDSLPHRQNTSDKTSNSNITSNSNSNSNSNISNSGGSGGGSNSSINGPLVSAFPCPPSVHRPPLPHPPPPPPPAETGGSTSGHGSGERARKSRTSSTSNKGKGHGFKKLFGKKT